MTLSSIGGTLWERFISAKWNNFSDHMDWCFRIHVCFQHHYKLCSLIFDPSNPWLFLELTGACYVAAGLYFRLISKLPTAQFLTPAAPNGVRRLYYLKVSEKNEKLENMKICTFCLSTCSAQLGDVTDSLPQLRRNLYIRCTPIATQLDARVSANRAILQRLN